MPARAADKVWFGGNGSFGIASNWSPGGVPGDGDNISVGGGRATLTFAQTVAGLSLSGGTLAGTGTLSVTGAASWTGGTMDDAGTTRFAGPLSITGANPKDIANRRVVETAGITTWGGNTAVNGNEIRFAVFGGGAINNSGTWLDQNTFDTRIGTRDGYTGTFNNLAGASYVKSGASVTSVDNAFDNAGAVDIRAGTLNLDGGGRSSGSFAIASGATLSLGGIYRLMTLNAPTFTGTGLLQIKESANGAGSTNVIVNGTSSHAGTLAVDGNFGVNGAFTVPTYRQTSGIVNGAGLLTVTGAASWTGGTMVDAGTTRFAGPLSITGANPKDIANRRVVETAGITTWGGNTAVNGNEIRFAVFGGGAINNSGTWLDQNTFDTRIGTRDGYTGTFNNLAGASYVKSGASVTSVDNAFDNAGAVDIRAGTLNLDGGGRSSGSFAIASGATLSLGGIYRLMTLNAPTFTGTGLLQIKESANGAGSTNVIVNGTSSHAGTLAVDGNFGVNGAFTVPTYRQTSGIVNGAGLLTVTGAASWTGGTMDDAGTTRFAGPLSITGANPKDIANRRVVETAGITTWGGNTAVNGNEIRFAVFGGGAINNSGTWLDQNTFDTRIGTRDGYTGTFNNLAGASYVKSGASVTSVDNAFDNAGRTSIVQGTLQLNRSLSNSGILTVSSGATLESASSFTNEGTLGGTGTLRLAPGRVLTNAGVLSPGFSPGTLTLDGNLLMTSSSRFDVELARLGSFDRLLVTGDVTLGGDLNLISLGYSPLEGDSFVIMTFADRVGDSVFSSINFAGFDASRFRVLYEEHDVRLSIAAAVPEPSSWALSLCGLGALLVWTRRRTPLRE